MTNNKNAKYCNIKNIRKIKSMHNILKILYALGIKSAKEPANLFWLEYVYMVTHIKQ